MPAEMHISARELEDEIRRQARTESELLTKGRDGADEVKDFAQSISPVGKVVDGDENPGKYRAGWHVEDRVRRIDGMPAYRVTNDDPKANMIEDGTGQNNPRSQGGSSPEFAIRAKTAARFGGTEELIVQ